MDNHVIGDRIKQRRLEIGMTLEDVANMVGVAVSTIQRYERGKIEKIKLPVVESIARALRVSPEWLIGKTDDMRVNKPDAKGQPEADGETIIQRIVRLIKEKGVNEKSFCNYIGVSQSTFVSWKNRGTNPNAKYLPDNV